MTAAVAAASSRRRPTRSCVRRESTCACHRRRCCRCSRFVRCRSVALRPHRPRMIFSLFLKCDMLPYNVFSFCSSFACAVRSTESPRTTASSSSLSSSSSLLP